MADEKIDDILARIKLMEDKNMHENDNVFCKDCVYAVRDENGDFNPEDIVCCYWNSDGLEAYDYCSRSKKGIYKPDLNDSMYAEYAKYFEKGIIL